MKVVVPALMVVCAAVSLSLFPLPFTHHAASNLTLFGKHARNFHKFGGISPLEVSGPDTKPYGDVRDHHYVEHPPLPAWLIGVSYAVFGVAEWSTRLPFALLTIACIALFAALARRLLDENEARLACVFFSLCPMYAYFSPVTGHQVPTLFFLIAGAFFFLRWRAERRPRDLAFLFAAQAAGCASDWPGYYLTLFLIAFTVLVDRKVWKIALASLGVNFLAFGVHLLWAYALEPDTGSCIGRLLAAGSSRASSTNLVAYAIGEAREMGIYFTLPLLVLSAGWMITRFRRPGETDRILWCFLVLGADELAFIHLAANHDFYTYYLVLFLSLTGARTAIQWARIPAGGRRPKLVLGSVLLVFLVQSAYFLHDRTTRQGGYLFYRDLGLALREETPPEARALILVDDIAHYTPFYGDRFALRYAVANRRMRYENLGRRFDDLPPEALPEFVRNRHGSFDVAVMSRTIDAVRENAFFQRLGLDAANPDHVSLMASFNVLPPDSELERTLEGLAARRVRRRGFTLYFFDRSR